MMIDPVPPVSQDFRAEQDLLGAWLKRQALELYPGFRSEWFHDPLHARIFRAIETAWRRRGFADDINEVIVADVLSDEEAAGGVAPDRTLAVYGGPVYLQHLAQRTPANIASAVRVIRDAHAQRQTLDFRARGVVTSSVCKCGCRVEIGAVEVDVAGMTVRASIRADGVHWPYGVEPGKRRASLDRRVRSEWLRLLGEQWAKELPTDGSAI